jgi:hypothetical protein
MKSQVWMKNLLNLLNVFRIFHYNTDYNKDKDMKNVDLCDETLYNFAGIYSRLEQTYGLHVMD